MLRFAFIFVVSGLGIVFYMHEAWAKDVPQENLYIPAGAFSHPTKLPPIQIGNYDQMPTIKRATRPKDNKTSLPQKTSSAKTLSTQTNSTNSSSSTELKKLNSHSRPDYKEKYDDYLDDLKVIGETGKIPDNPELDADLKNMNSDKKFEIE